MPLIHSASKTSFSHNVAAEMHAGKPQKQAVAIAYSEKRKHMAEGGMPEGEMVDVDKDHDEVMNHVALECMHAIEDKDTYGFMESLHVLIADILNKMSVPEEGE